MPYIKNTLFFVFTCCLGTLVGCNMYTPGGNPFTNAPDSAATYESNAEMPKNITLLDTRTGEHIFEMEIPVGKKLVIQFIKGAGDNEVFTPDLMMWEVFPSSKEYGPLSNSLTVPDRWSRRIDMTLRPSGEYPSPMSDRPLRVDEVNDQPDWWTPKGGAFNGSDPVNGYDN